MKLSDLPELVFRGQNLQLRTTPDATDEGKEIFDPVRQKFVALTPEEWVRQNCINMLVNSYGYSFHRMSNEMSFKLNFTRRRSDTVIINDFAEPVMVIEFKAADVKLTDKVFSQILRYNTVLGARFLVVTNGMLMMGIDTCPYEPEKSYLFMNEIPEYAELKTLRKKPRLGNSPLV